ncbi:MAG: hypothetical protein IPK70_00235 [Flavobacteriales bacterium]|nr:hypothetical protein [Flavobacteriales bacterium]
MHVSLLPLAWWALLTSVLLSGCNGCGRRWEVIKDIGTHCAPAISQDSRGLIMAVVDSLGRVAVRNSTKPGEWSDWTIVADEAEPRTSPEVHFFRAGPLVFVQVFYRGDDDNLYLCQRTDGQWSANPFALTTDGSVRGRFSTCRTETITHCLHIAGPTTVNYRSGTAYSFPLRHQFQGAVDGTLAPRSGFGTGAVMVLRYANKVTAFANTGTADPPAELETRHYPFGTNDISNVVAQPKKLVFPPATYSHHVLLDTRKAAPDSAGRSTQALQHWMIDAEGGRARAIPVMEYSAQGEHTRSALAAYRSKLVALWRTADGGLSNARLDDADPSMPWIVDERIRYAMKPEGRPALCAYDHRPHIPIEERRTSRPNYGNDLFAAASQRGRAMFEALSRTWFQELVDDEFKLFHSPVSEGCAGTGDPDAPVALGPAASIDSPFITELGFGSWVLPAWLIDGQWRRVGGYMCANHPDWHIKGRTPLPCATARMPVIMKESGPIYFCAGPWMNYDVDHTVYWEELGHYLTFPMGICNDCPFPTQENALTAIQLGARQQAHALFNEGTGTNCGDVARCPGFVGWGGNYDMTGREHSFIYAVHEYINNGGQMRTWIQQDLAMGNTLLRRKYNWIRDEIFRGVEF